MERQTGYYWVKRSGFSEIAFWSDARKKWYLIGELTSFDDSEFEHINENRIKYPGELPDL